MKISYIHGPGDAVSTYTHWKQGQADISIIKQTYSGQFFDLISEIDGEGQVICIGPIESCSDIHFRFESVRRRSGSGLKFYLDEFMYALAISALIKTFDPDIIILSSDFPSYFLDVLPSHSVKIISMHNTFWRPYGQPASLKNKIINVVRKLALRNTNFAVCVSSECQRQFQIIRSNPSVFSVVQIPRITEQFQEKSDISPRNMLFVGRIEIEKGIEDLIYAFRMLKHDLPDINLKVIGDGNALEYLRGLALTLGLKSDIDFTGRLNALEVGRSYAEADLCICPTHWSFNEGLATVPLEAASYGVPTIMSHAVPAKEQFGSGAITFEPGNIDDLADKIRYAILDERAFQNARKDARESFARTMADTRDWKAGIHSCLNKLPKHRS